MDKMHVFIPNWLFYGPWCSQELVIRGDKEPPKIARILGIHPYVLGGTKYKPCIP